MASYKEIVTKAVVGKGKKTFTTTHSVSPSVAPTTILGCWVINHSFNGTKDSNVVTISGSYDVNIWYSSLNNTKTEVISDTVNYNEKVNVKMTDDNYDGNEEIIVRSLKQPNCVKAEIVDGNINYTIEKELSAEVVGDAKIRVGINEEEAEWDDDVNKEGTPTTETNNIEQEINDSVQEDFLG